MAVRASREVVFEAPPEAILDALADIDEVSTWSSLHKHAEVVDRHPDGKPRHVKATLKIMGITDKEMLEYHWGHDWMVWDATETLQQSLVRLGLGTSKRGEYATPLPKAYFAG
jgi:hypothetical protein